ncbi:MAG: hypothetical protein ACODAU_10060 [Myxococcota bacterium]
MAWFVLAALAALGCSDDPSGTGGGDAGSADGGGTDDAGSVDGGEAGDAGAIQVSLAPVSAQLRVGARETFTATVSGTADDGVAWDTSCGSVEVDGPRAVFTAPWEVVAGCTLTATSESDPSRRATAEIDTTVLSPHQLLPNPAFGEDIEGWFTYSDAGEPRAVWNEEDATDATSGSAEIRHFLSGGNALVAGLRTECLPSTAGLAYHLGASMRMLETAENTELQVRIQSFDDAECSGENRVGTGEQISEATSTEWTNAYQTYTAPEGTTRIRISVGIFKPSGVDDDARALIDNLFLYPQEPPPAEMEGSWAGMWGNGSAEPSAEWTLVLHPNGIYDVDTPGTDGAGVYWVSEGTLAGAHTYDSDTTFAIAAEVDDAFTRIEGTWGSPPEGTDGGSFYVDKQ